MDFTYPGSSNWDTDEITSSNPINYGSEDIFTTKAQIAAEMAWPKKGRVFTTPDMETRYKTPRYAAQKPSYMVPTQKFAGGRPRGPSEHGDISSTVSNIATGFTSGLRSGGADGPQMTETTLMLLLLVILVVLCSMIYSTVKQTCDTVKLLASIMIASGR
jgi:hypothetical protein